MRYCSGWRSCTVDPIVVNKDKEPAVRRGNFGEQSYDGLTGTCVIHIQEWRTDEMIRSPESSLIVGSELSTQSASC